MNELVRRWFNIDLITRHVHIERFNMSSPHTTIVLFLECFLCL